MGLSWETNKFTMARLGFYDRGKVNFPIKQLGRMESIRCPQSTVASCLQANYGACPRNSASDSTIFATLYVHTYGTNFNRFEIHNFNKTAIRPVDSIQFNTHTILFVRAHALPRASGGSSAAEFHVDVVVQRADVGPKAI